MPPRLKGEGGANRVYEYHYNGPEVPYARVVRVRKRSTNGFYTDDRERAVEEEVWSDIVRSVGGLQTPEADLWYIDNVIKPVIGGAYILPKVVIKLTEEEQTLFCDEPQDKAILMPDATMLPCDNLTVCIESICFEIKPKYGGITLCDTVSPSHREMKRSNSRYRLHQFLKLSQGKISKLSAYDPQDFFSGDPKQMNAALVSLLTNPQNNCAVFINGIKITLETGLKRAASILFGARITAANNNLDTIHTISLLLQKILLQENVLLEQILSLQRSCGYDIEGVFRLYRSLVEETTEEMIDDSRVAKQDECQQRAVSKLLSLPRPEAIAVLHSYCLATMARDCSLMITVGRDGKGDDEADQAQATNCCQSSGWTLQSCGRLKLTLQDIEDSYLYKISVVDLDRKPLSKIPRHRALDTEILVAAQRYA